jgi:hypothetical protein
MTRTQLALLSVSALLLGACASRQHSYTPYESTRTWFRDVRPQVAPADAVGFRVGPPSADYPLTTCVVSGAELRPWVGATPRRMDGPMAVVYQGTEVQLCCSACIADFRRDPDRYVAAVRMQRT